MEGAASTSRKYSRRLPPPEAWKNPSKWIDLSTGLARKDASKLVLPTDYYDFVKPDASIEYVTDYFFWNDYDWPYDQSDPETALDRHHFQHRASAYAAGNFAGDKVPSKVREIAPHIGLIPRQLHNVLHDFTAEPIVPSLDAMYDRYDAFLLAHRAFQRLIVSAEIVSHASRRFNDYKASHETMTSSIPAPYDEVEQAMMVDFFKRHFTEYGLAVEEILRLEGRDYVPYIENKSVFEKPHLVVKKLGKLAYQSHINLTPRSKVA